MKAETTQEHLSKAALARMEGPAYHSINKKLFGKLEEYQTWQSQEHATASREVLLEQLFRATGPYIERFHEEGRI